MTNIYVGNLSYNATEDDLRQAFSQFGDVSSVSVIKDRETGRPRGFAFVEMPDSSQAAEAIENINNTEIAGRNVTVNEARPREDRGGGGGRRGGGERRYLAPSARPFERPADLGFIHTNDKPTITPVAAVASQAAGMWACS